MYSGVLGFSRETETISLNKWGERQKEGREWERGRKRKSGERKGEREGKGKDDTKALVQVILGAGKPKIYRASWQARDPENS